MRVGVVEDWPWASRPGGQARGVEVELAREFARSLGAHPEWFWGGGAGELTALNNFQLDLVIANLDAKTPWAKSVGLTRPYLTDEFVVGLPAASACRRLKEPRSISLATISLQPI